MPARRFLWVIAIIIMIVIAAAFAYALFAPQLMRLALVPSADFGETDAGPRPDYARLSGWAAHPGHKSDAARWTPEGYRAAPQPGIAVFYVLPTTVFDRSRWNGRVDDVEANKRVDMFLKSQASIFNGVGAIWAPRYRQATFGSFLTDKPQAKQAIDFAYADVLAAFDAFVAAQPASRPIILAGHSQGSLHLMRLLQQRVAGKPLSGRIVAVYAPGWPMSVAADLPAMGLPACAREDMSGCILSWQSFAQPIDASAITEIFQAGTGLAGSLRKGTAMVCTNPIAGTVTGAAIPASANIGSLVPTEDFSGGNLVPKAVAAQCRADGILDIGAPPSGFTAFILPGNNFHVYDYPLFWANLRADVERRVAGFGVPAP
jgi:hypothetical protein